MAVVVHDVNAGLLIQAPTLISLTDLVWHKEAAVVYAFVLGRLRAGDLEFGHFVEAWRQVIGKPDTKPDEER